MRVLVGLRGVDEMFSMFKDKYLLRLDDQAPVGDR